MNKTAQARKRAESSAKKSRCINSIHLHTALSRNILYLRCTTNRVLQQTVRIAVRARKHLLRTEPRVSNLHFHRVDGHREQREPAMCFNLNRQTSARLVEIQSPEVTPTGTPTHHLLSLKKKTAAARTPWTTAEATNKVSTPSHLSSCV